MVFKKKFAYVCFSKPLFCVTDDCFAEGPLGFRQRREPMHAMWHTVLIAIATAPLSVVWRTVLSHVHTTSFHCAANRSAHRRARL